jgi:hypothetical protein
MEGNEENEKPSHYRKVIDDAIEKTHPGWPIPDENNSYD